MKIDIFELERIQSVWENRVKYNLTESGVHPYNLRELLTEKEIENLLTIRLGYGQTNGSIELREAICNLYPNSDIDNVLVTNGSAEANFLGIWSNLEPEDEILVMLPNYMQIWGIARSFGVKVKPFYLKEDLEWQPDLKELRTLITTKTKMIVVCNPNNPTGSVLNRVVMEEIVSLAKANNAWIYADEIYRGAELEGDEIQSFWGLYDKVIIACGLSKSYALPGLRIGWLVGPKPIIEKAWSYHDYTSIATGVLSNNIATIALQPEMRKKILSRNRNMLRENLKVLEKWLVKHEGMFHYVPPKAGGIVFLRYSLPINSTELVTKLREEKSCFIVAGDCFGMDKYIRIGIGSEKEYFLAGLALLSELIEGLKK
ncbi:MAG: aminotransferase class I/II-fold pyridoxal phosphate-dependent enzyme [Candidatus Kariarchaeaceae archaeon]